MTCDALEHPERKVFLSIDPISRLASVLFRPNPELDIRILSDHMKRDMGFMDWGAPRREDEMLR
ncbi:hypothetical protein ILFOPFJJ_01121 [Ensifer psoraleae]|nr:hypothetical protein [Sinorhizobium psoraleae]